MKIFLVSTLMSKEKIKFLEAKYKMAPMFSIQKFNRLLCEGLKNNNLEVETISSLPITHKITKKLFWFDKSEIEDGIRYTYIPFINFKILRNVSTLFNCTLIILKKIFLSKRDDYFICDVLNKTIFITTNILCRVFKKKCIAIVTDLPQYVGVKLSSIYNDCLSKCNYYVFLTQEMNNKINKNNRPFVVVEGIVDDKLCLNRSAKYDKCTLMYAGGLYEKYGLKNLISAVEQLDNIYLYLYGNGDIIDYIKNKNFKNTFYKGNVTNDVIIKEERKCTLLVNPRFTNEEFVKYSFPSKNLEYMCSGTPVLTTCLPGMPIEYYDYVYTINDESIEGMKKAIKCVQNLDKKSLTKKGRAAQLYVLKHKNKNIQAKKIILMIKEKKV